MIGRSITMDGRPHTVVGVMPQSATLPTEWQYRKPLEYNGSITNPKNVFALW